MLKNIQNKKIILASQSPRRRELLAGLDLEFEVMPLHAEEIYDPEELKREQITEFLCEVKAQAFQQWEDDILLITADTIVWMEERAVEKPKSRGEAIEMLELLSGKNHEVISSAAIYSPSKKIIVTDVAKVRFGDLSTEEITYYVDKYQPYDKAGGYGVQEWIGYVGVEEIVGSYYTIMGFPVHPFFKALKKF